MAWSEYAESVLQRICETVVWDILASDVCQRIQWTNLYAPMQQTLHNSLLFSTWQLTLIHLSWGRRVWSALPRPENKKTSKKIASRTIRCVEYVTLGAVQLLINVTAESFAKLKIVTWFLFWPRTYGKSSWQSQLMRCSRPADRSRGSRYLHQVHQNTETEHWTAMSMGLIHCQISCRNWWETFLPKLLPDWSSRGLSLFAHHRWKEDEHKPGPCVSFWVIISNRDIARLAASG